MVCLAASLLARPSLYVSNSAETPQIVSSRDASPASGRRFLEQDIRTLRCTCLKGKIYSSAPTEDGVELFHFDEGYYRRLQDRDPSTEEHFVEYFCDLLRIKLRCRLKSRQAMEDVQQETFVRVLAAVRSGTGVRQPDRLGAFVNSVCNNVLLEFYRSTARDPQERDEPGELADRSSDLLGFLVTQQTCRQVRDVLARLPERDRSLLRALFLEEKDKDQLCQEFGVGRDYLRVLLHRAKQSFRSMYEERQGVEPRVY